MAKIKRKVIFLTADGIRHEARAKTVSEHTHVDRVIDRPILTQLHCDPSNIERKVTGEFRRYTLFDRRMDTGAAKVAGDYTEVLVYKEKV